MNHEHAQTTTIQQINDLLPKKLDKTFAARIRREIRIRFSDIFLAALDRLRQKHHGGS